MTDRRTQGRMPAGFPVTHILGDDDQHVCTAADVSADGMRVVAEGEGWRRSRFAWLQFRLPGEPGTVIRALGELCHEAPAGPGEARGFRFKYIYPRDRRRFEAFLTGDRAAG